MLIINNIIIHGIFRKYDLTLSNLQLSFDLLFFSSTLLILPDDCATLLLACLHCRFHELMVLLPGTCEGAVQHCFPSYKHITESGERDQQGQDCCNYKLELDCNFCGSCQDAGELIELAMEISEVCYHWEIPFVFKLWPANKHYNCLILLVVGNDKYCM